MTRFRTCGPRFTLDALRRHDDEPDTIEIRNHVPGETDDVQRDDEENGEVVARYPSSYHVQTEGDEIVVYSRPPKTKTDLYDFDDPGTRDHRAVRSLGDLNRLHDRHYQRRKPMAVR